MSVEKTKEKTWKVRFRDSNGRQRSETFPTKKLAERFELDLKMKKAQGKLITPDHGDMTVADFFENVLLPTKPVSESTKDGYRRDWGCKDPSDDEVWHLRRKWGALTLRSANQRESVLRWHTEMRDAGATDAKVHRAHQLLSTIIGYAVELDGYLHESRIMGTQPEYEPAENGDPWLPVEIEAIRADLLHRAEHPPRGWGGVKRPLFAWRRRRDAVAVSVMGYAALRLGECFALQWPMLLAGNSIATHVEVRARVPSNEKDREDRLKTTRRGSRRSTRKPRIVELEDALRADLRGWWMLNGRPTTGYVFPASPASPGGPRFRQTDFARWRDDIWHVSVRNVGLGDATPRHLRVSCVSMWIREGRDPGTVADMAGHGEQVMWATYRKAFVLRMGAREPLNVPAAIAAARSGVHKMCTDADSAATGD